MVSGALAHLGFNGGAAGSNKGLLDVANWGRFDGVHACDNGFIGIVAARSNGGYDYDGQRGGQGDYDEFERQPAPRYMPQPKGQAPGSFLGLLQNQKQLGATLLAVGFFLTIMGMALFFEGNLLRLGNICMILGIPMLLGPDRVRGFFMKQSRIQATIITSIGIFLVFVGKPRLGILCEIFGLLNLFGNMFPLLLALAKRMPIIGDIISSIESAGTGAGVGAGGRRARAAPF